MRKFLITLLSVSTVSAFAADNSQFQKFDNEYNLGYGVANTQFYNGIQNQALQQSQFMSLEVERLFDAGIWLDATANLVTAQNSLGNQATGTGQGNSGVPGYPGTPSTQDPNFGGANFKVGYAFTVLPENLQLIPYALVGRNTNLAMSTLLSNGLANVSNDFYYTAGIGGRIEYKINDYIFLYADQNAVYNWDQSGPLDGIQPQNFLIAQSTIGAKFNVVKNLQLGVSGFYKYYQLMADVPTATPALNGGNDSNGNSVTLYEPSSSLGGMVSIGLTY
ncbi:MAG: hypothetical protein ORN24_00085 [Burkholderiales bacterium]|nr:hypothetical protein [Burkholderiales bacterium]